MTQVIDEGKLPAIEHVGVYETYKVVHQLELDNTVAAAVARAEERREM